MCTWDDLQDAKQRMVKGYPPCLTMHGVMHDNATSYLLTQKGTEFNNNDQIFATATDSPDDFRDFVWFRQTVRVEGPFGSGGHPSLAGFRGVYCAGRVARRSFDFHSGHYHPKLKNVVHYMYEFIENSCLNLHGAIRDKKVKKLCKIPLALYFDDSETAKYETTFGRILAQGLLERNYASKNTMTMGESRLPSGYREEPAMVPFNSTQSIVNSGVTPHVQHQATFRPQRRANWVNDDECTKCPSCKRDFSFFLRKHHCRQCGGVYCDDCSDNQKQLARPAIRPRSDPETGLVRVCDGCARTPEPI